MPLICPARKRPAIFLGFERALEFGGIDRVVLDGVAGTQHLGGFEAGNRLQDRELHIDRQRRAHAVDVDFVRVQAFGLEEELVRGLVGKLDDLVFDRRAIARSDGLNLAAVHRRAVHVLADDAMRFRRGPRDVAGHLRVVMRDALGAEAEGRGIDIAGLHLESRPVDGAAIEARRRAGLQAASAQAEFLERFAEQNGGRFAGASGGILLFAAVDEAVEEGAGGDDDGLGADGAAIAKANAADRSRRSSVVGRREMQPASLRARRLSASD